jgi:hypothetical protein
MNRHEDFIEKLLFNNSYLLAQDLNAALQTKFGVSGLYGRKIIERAVEAYVIVPSAIRFGKNQFAYVHPKKQLTKELVLQIAAKHRPPLFRLIVGLDMNNGIISHYEAMKIAACPIEDAKTKRDSVDKLFLEIELLGYASQFANKDGVRFLISSRDAKHAEYSMAKAIKQMSIDAMFVPDVLRALQRFNIISNDRVLYRNKTEPQLGVNHNNFKWDAIAYTRTTGINEARSSESNTYDKQTLVVLDVIVSRKYTDHDLQGFLSRIQGTINSVKTGKRKVLPIVVYSGIESKILINRIKKLGFLSFDLGTIYGSKIYRIIECIQSVKNTDDFTEGTIDDRIEEALETIENTGQADNLSNIKGDLFESLMFPVLNTIFSGSDIETSKELKNTSEGKTEKYEYDYIIRSSRLREITIIELKGFASSRYIDVGDIERNNTLNWFFGRTLPFAKKMLLSHGLKITASYITTAKFTNEGTEFLESLQNGSLKPKVLDVWYDGTKLLNFLKEHGFQKPLELVQKYYIKPEPSKVKVPFVAEDKPYEIETALETSLPDLDDF